MLLQKEKIKEYITFGNDVEAYVYRNNNELWFIAFQDEVRKTYYSRLLISTSSNCSYFVHKSIEEVESFLINLIKIEEIVNSNGYKFENFIAQYWNVITDNLLFHWKENNNDITPYINTLIKNWIFILDKYKIEFEILIEKKRNKWDLYSIWDDEKLYELSKKFGYIIPDDVLKSKNEAMLDSLLSKTNELLDMLNNNEK